MTARSGAYMRTQNDILHERMHGQLQNKEVQSNEPLCLRTFVYMSKQTMPKLPYLTNTYYSAYCIQHIIFGFVCLYQLHM